MSNSWQVASCVINNADKINCFFFAKLGGVSDERKNMKIILMKFQQKGWKLILLENWVARSRGRQYFASSRDRILACAESKGDGLSHVKVKERK